jgi:hypothetical protein
MVVCLALIQKRSRVETMHRQSRPTTHLGIIIVLDHDEVAEHQHADGVHCRVQDSTCMYQRTE